MKNYSVMLSKQEKATALADATGEGELDAMWAAWEAQGWSRDGLLYATVLARKQELGVKLPEGDVERIEQAEEVRRAGAALPPITGTLRS